MSERIELTHFCFLILGGGGARGGREGEREGGREEDGEEGRDREGERWRRRER